MGLVLIVVGTVLIFWLLARFLCRRPSVPNWELMVPVSGDRVDSTLEPGVVVDVAPDSFLAFGDIFASVLLQAVDDPPELKSL